MFAKIQVFLTQVHLSCMMNHILMTCFAKTYCKKHEKWSTVEGHSTVKRSVCPEVNLPLCLHSLYFLVWLKENQTAVTYFTNNTDFKLQHLITSQENNNAVNVS